MEQGTHPQFTPNFSSYTKMGYAGNVEPSHIVPTVFADHVDKVNPKNIYLNPNRAPSKFPDCNTTNSISTLEMKRLNTKTPTI